MSVNKKFENVFTSMKDIPKEFQLSGEIIQKEYLINGEIKYWKGEMQDVLSPICLVENKNEQLKLGSYPKLIMAFYLPGKPEIKFVISWRYRDLFPIGKFIIKRSAHIKIFCFVSCCCTHIEHERKKSIGYRFRNFLAKKACQVSQSRLLNVLAAAVALMAR